jgi:hypothetical protein
VKVGEGRIKAPAAYQLMSADTRRADEGGNDESERGKQYQEELKVAAVAGLKAVSASGWDGIAEDLVLRAS